MFLLNNTPLGVDVPFTYNDVQYPANWLRLASIEEREAIGITEVQDKEQYDDRFYWDVDLPKDLDQCKQNLILQIKQTAASLLSQTSWMIERFNDPSSAKVIPEKILLDRMAIRLASDENEIRVNAATTIPELVSVVFTWPTND